MIVWFESKPQNVEGEAGLRIPQWTHAAQRNRIEVGALSRRARVDERLIGVDIDVAQIVVGQETW
jgi:hypothetical protein